jgi:hypothetical protein
MRLAPYAASIALLSSTAPLRASNEPNPPEPVRLSAEIDPLPFFQHGFSVHVAAKPAGRLRFTLGTFGLTLPAAPAGSTNEGWTAKQLAIEMSASYFLLDSKIFGLFGGLYVFGQRWGYQRADVPGEATSYWITPAPALGVQCLPWGKGFYITPWAALGFPIHGSAPQLGGRAYEEPKLFPVLALHLGFEVSI